MSFKDKNKVGEGLCCGVFEGQTHQNNSPSKPNLIWNLLSLGTMSDRRFALKSPSCAQNPDSYRDESSSE